jgi:hypothetical protein
MITMMMMIIIICLKEVFISLFRLRLWSHRLLCRPTWGFFLISWDEVRLCPLGTSAINWSIVPSPDNRWWWVWRSRWNENWRWKSKYSEKKAALVPVCLPQMPHALGSNPCRRCGKSANNHLSYGTAGTWKDDTNDNLRRCKPEAFTVPS